MKYRNFGSLDPGFIVHFSFLWRFPVVGSQNLFVATFFYIAYSYNLYVCKSYNKGRKGGGGGRGGMRVSIAFQRLLKILFDNIHSQCSDINSINGSNNNNNQRFISFFFNVNRFFTGATCIYNVMSKRSRKQLCVRLEILVIASFFFFTARKIFDHHRSLRSFTHRIIR